MYSPASIAMLVLNPPNKIEFEIVKSMTNEKHDPEWTVFEAYICFYFYHVSVTHKH